MNNNHIMSSPEFVDADETLDVDELNGLLVEYKDDELDESVNSTLRRKSRVRYKCMDTFSNYLAFGASSGAIYMFRLDNVKHVSCSLTSTIPCDQGSIEVLRFLANPAMDDLLIVVGTARGSLVVFRVVQLPGEQDPICTEIYRAQSFTNNQAIKLIEFDSQLLVDGSQWLAATASSSSLFSKLYICDTADRLYVLDSSSIYANKQSLRLFYSNHMPSLVFSANDSKINQISVHKSQLLISTDETTRLFNEQSNKLHVIGTKKRKPGFFGACFFNPAYRPARVLHMADTDDPGAQQYTSASSLSNPEQLLIFVARPLFRLWQVHSSKLSVMFTHQFEPLVAASTIHTPLELHTEPLGSDQSTDDPSELAQYFKRASKQNPNNNNNNDNTVNNNDNSKQSALTSPNPQRRPQSQDHFGKIMPIYSSTLGNLLLSYSQHEIFVVDPIKARLIAWQRQEGSIVHVSCNENEFFVWSFHEGRTDDSRRLRLKRLVLLAPTQLVLELHRLHRYISLMTFVELFADLFCRRMALPLNGPSLITTEGGLLRNVLLNAWDAFKSRRSRSLVNQSGDPADLNRTGELLSDEDDIEDDISDENNQDDSPQDANSPNNQSSRKRKFADFRRMVRAILEESRQLACSLENVNDSQFFLAMTSDNIDRLCSEPYASLVSLQVCIADLHKSRVIQLTKSSQERYKSLASLSESIKSGLQAARRQAAESHADLSSTASKSRQQQQPANKLGSLPRLADKRVIVERQRVRRKLAATQAKNGQRANCENRPLNGATSGDEHAAGSGSLGWNLCEPSFVAPTPEALEAVGCESRAESASWPVDSDSSPSDQTGSSPAPEVAWRCPGCRWPRPGAHLPPLGEPREGQERELRWLEENLLASFEENIDEIERRAFEHALWPMYLRCLAFRNKLDDYITCCMMLDDVRLLDMDQFVIRRGGEQVVVDRLLELLERQLPADRRKPEVCLRCSAPLPAPQSAPAPSKLNQGEANEEEQDDEAQRELEQGRTFNLVNLFEHVILRRRNQDVRRAVGRLASRPALLERSTLPASFYLRAIASAAQTAAQSRQRVLVNTANS